MIDDKTAVTMIRNGNTDAYSILVERYSTPLYRAALAIIHDPHAAEDVLQDTLISGYIKLNTLNEPEKFYPWIMRTLKNRSFNYLSRARTAEPEDSAEYMEAIADQAETPEEAVISGDAASKVEEAISRLPDSLSETARLFFLCGLKQSQIAAHLHIPVGTVKRRIHDAKQKLKKELYTMKENTNVKPSDGFTTRVIEKINELENYNKIHGSSIGFDAAYRHTLSLIHELSDKTEADKLAAKAAKTAYHVDEEKYADDAIQNAVQNNDPLLLADAYITKWSRIDGNAQILAYMEDTVIPTLEALPDSNEKFAALGRVKFWAHYHAIEEKQFDKARIYLTSSKELLTGCAHLVSNENQYYTAKEYYLSMYACALAGEKGMERLKNLPYREDMYHLNITSHGWKKENGNLKLIYQPGFGTGSGGNTNIYRYADEIYYYAACGGDGWFFPHTEKEEENEVVHKEYDNSPVVQSIVSRTESVLTPAGVFENCLHIRKTDSESTYDIWYAENVGIVRFDDSITIGSVSTYLLSEYEHRGGEGYLPLETGNRWRYTNSSAPDGVEGHCEYTVVRNDEDFVYLTAVCESGVRKDAPEDTPEVMMLMAEKFVADGNCDKNDYDSYMKVMEQVIIANKSRESVEIALNAVDYLKERKVYSDGKYRFLPSSCNMSSITRKNGRVYYTETDMHSIDTGRWGTRGDAENRIFGAKPFRYPNMLAGCIWNDEWEMGYTETKKLSWDELTYTLTVSDGGTVTTKAGTFADCRKVTITCEDPSKEGHYYFYSYVHCGTKEYWYAPGVGIVYHRCQWGPADSQCELVSYHTVAKEGEYMPVHLGNRWSYEEKNLTREGYVARRDYGIVSGMNDSFLLRDNQMFVYKGTEEEYEEWKKNGCPAAEAD